MQPSPGQHSTAQHTYRVQRAEAGVDGSVVQRASGWVCAGHQHGAGAAATLAAAELGPGQAQVYDWNKHEMEAGMTLHRRRNKRIMSHHARSQQHALRLQPPEK